MASTKPTMTTIRMGAAHYDLTVEQASGQTVELDLTKARWPDKSAMARHLCEAYGIKGDRPAKPHRHRHRPKKRLDPNTTQQQEAKRNGKHKQGHRAAGQLPGEDALRQAPAGDGPKKRSRRRRTPRTVPAPGPSTD